MKKLLLPLLLAGGLTALATPPGWITSFDDAAKQSQEKGKPILLDFTGSDWCGWCVKMHKETLGKKAFTEFASTGLILVEVDFPNKVPQTAEQKAANAKLKDKYGVRGYPTFVLVDQTGKELGRQEGYLAGGPEAFLAKIKEWRGSPAGK